MEKKRNRKYGKKEKIEIKDVVEWNS